MENSEVSSEAIGDLIPKTVSGHTRGKRFNWNWVIAPALLIVGGLIGYLGRPLMTSVQPTAAHDTQPILQLLISKTRHWQGDANAPITILEFSDFQ